MRSLIRFVCIVVFWGFFQQSYSTQIIQSRFEEQYPNSVSANRDCQICHKFSTGGGNWNSYGTDLFINSQFTSNIFEVFEKIEENDSDGDGLTNLIEIENGFDPGWSEGLTNTITYANGESIDGFAPPFLDIDGGYDENEEICFPVQFDFESEPSTYCL